MSALRQVITARLERKKLQLADISPRIKLEAFETPNYGSRRQLELVINNPKLGFGVKRKEMMRDLFFTNCWQQAGEAFHELPVSKAYKTLLKTLLIQTGIDDFTLACQIELSHERVSQFIDWKKDIVPTEHSRNAIYETLAGAAYPPSKDDLELLQNFGRQLTQLGVFVNRTPSTTRGELSRFIDRVMQDRGLPITAVEGLSHALSEIDNGKPWLYAESLERLRQKTGIRGEEERRLDELYVERVFETGLKDHKPVDFATIFDRNNNGHLRLKRKIEDPCPEMPLSGMVFSIVGKYGISFSHLKEAMKLNSYQPNEVAKRITGLDRFPKRYAKIIDAICEVKTISRADEKMMREKLRFCINAKHGVAR